MNNMYEETRANQDFLKVIMKKKKKKRKSIGSVYNLLQRPMVEQTLRPVTIKQMKDANVAKSGSACEIDKADCDQVKSFRDKYDDSSSL